MKNFCYAVLIALAFWGALAAVYHIPYSAFVLIPVAGLISVWSVIQSNRI